MRKSKYIIIQHNQHLTVPYIFSDLMNHDQIARAVANSMYPIVIGAGFCYVEDGLYVCYGKSESLQVESQPGDSDTLNALLGMFDQL